MINHTNDALLVENLVAGNEDAFNIVFQNYYKSLCTYASRYVAQSECEEIVQTVMLWLWENRKMLNRDVLIKPFLFSAVKNKCVNRVIHLRMRNRVMGEIQAKYKNAFSIHNGYEHREVKNLLITALPMLPPEYRKTFVMNRFLNMTYSEIAEEMGISQKTVAYRIVQTLKRLRVVFKDYLTP